MDLKLDDTKKIQSETLFWGYISLIEMRSRALQAYTQKLAPVARFGDQEEKISKYKIWLAFDLKIEDHDYTGPVGLFGRLDSFEEKARVYGVVVPRDNFQSVASVATSIETSDWKIIHQAFRTKSYTDLEKKVLEIEADDLLDNSFTNFIV